MEKCNPLHGDILTKWNSDVSVHKSVVRYNEMVGDGLGEDNVGGDEVRDDG